VLICEPRVSNQITHISLELSYATNSFVYLPFLQIHSVETSSFVNTFVNGLCHVPVYLNIFSRTYPIKARCEVTKFVYLFRIFLNIALTSAGVILKFSDCRMASYGR